MRASLEGGRGWVAACRAIGAWTLWLAVAAGGLSAILDLVDAVRAGRSARDGVIAVAAAMSFAVMVGAMASIPAACIAALVRRRLRHGRRAARLYPGIAFAGATAAAWWITDPLARRLTTVYIIFCLAAGTAVALAAWLSRSRALPEVAAASLIALTAAFASTLGPSGAYLELRDLAFLVALAGALAASCAVFGGLARHPAAPVAAGLVLLAALAVPVFLDVAAPDWRLMVHVHRPGAARLARAVRLVVDLDRDGSSPVLRGADCNDLDSSVHPLALDLPGGGDANCNGVDAPAEVDELGRGLAAPSGDPSLPAGMVDRLLLITIDCWRADALDADLMPAVSAFATGGLVFDRLYAAGTSTTKSLPLVVGVGPRGPWVADLVSRHGVRARAVIAGSVPASLWGFREVRIVPTTARHVTDAALELVGAAPSSGRELIWLHYFDLHALRHYREQPPVPSGPAHLPDAYRTAAHHVDRGIGRLLAELERRGQLARTAVLITGDHGEGLGAHGVSNHGQTGFEEVLRVPGILRGPGIPAERVSQLASHRDLPATMLGALGLRREAIAAEYFGRSWLRLRSGTAAPLHTFVVARSARWVSGSLSSAALGVLVEERYKLVAGLEDGLFELYDLSADPGETHDIASLAPEVRQRLWRQLATVWDVDYQPRGGR